MASHLIDLGGTCTALTTIAAGGGGLGTMSGQIGITSGLVNTASGGVVGQSCNLQHADSYCNLLVQGQLLNGSGQLRIAVQCSDTDTSGSYVDPTSGFSVFPGPWQSGGILWLNSGALLGTTFNAIQTGATSGVPASGYAVQSGFTVAAGFIRNGIFARAVALSGDFYVGPLSVSFISQSRETSSGGGFTMSPLANSIVNV